MTLTLASLLPLTACLIPRSTSSPLSPCSTLGKCVRACSLSLSLSRVRHSPLAAPCNNRGDLSNALAQSILPVNMIGMFMSMLLLLLVNHVSSLTTINAGLQAHSSSSRHGSRRFTTGVCAFVPSANLRRLLTTKSPLPHPHRCHSCVLWHSCAPLSEPWHTSIRWQLLVDHAHLPVTSTQRRLQRYGPAPDAHLLLHTLFSHSCGYLYLL